MRLGHMFPKELPNKAGFSGFTNRLLEWPSVDTPQAKQKYFDIFESLSVCVFTLRIILNSITMQVCAHASPRNLANVPRRTSRTECERVWLGTRLVWVLPFPEWEFQVTRMGYVLPFPEWVVPFPQWEYQPTRVGCAIPFLESQVAHTMGIAFSHTGNSSTIPMLGIQAGPTKA